MSTRMFCALSITLGFALTSGLFLASAADATGIVGVRLTNDPTDFGGDLQRGFSPYEEVYIFMDLSYGSEDGYDVYGRCDIDLEVTGSELARVRIPFQTVYEEPSVRSEGFRMAWPQAWVTVTCTSERHNRERTFRLDPQYWLSHDGSAAAAAPGGNAAPEVVYVAVEPQVVPAPEPLTCRQVLLAQGHEAFDLDYCDGVNQQCAVALLQAGHDPFDLSYCDGVRDIDCAVQLLQVGGSPFDLSNCD